MIVLSMSFNTDLHPTQSPCSKSSAGIESHKATTVTCQLRRKRSKVLKLHGLTKRRWKAGSKECNLCDNRFDAVFVIIYIVIVVQVVRTLDL